MGWCPPCRSPRGLEKVATTRSILPLAVMSNICSVVSTGGSRMVMAALAKVPKSPTAKTL